MRVSVSRLSSYSNIDYYQHLTIPMYIPIETCNIMVSVCTKSTYVRALLLSYTTKTLINLSALVHSIHKWIWWVWSLVVTGFCLQFIKRSSITHTSTIQQTNFKMLYSGTYFASILSLKWNIKVNFAAMNWLAILLELTQ